MVDGWTTYTHGEYGGRAPRVSPRCAWQIVGGEAVLLDLHGRRLLGLNATGSFLLPLLDGVRTEADLAAKLAACFEVAPAQAERDVAAFLTDLAGRGFVEGGEP